MKNFRLKPAWPPEEPLRSGTIECHTTKVRNTPFFFNSFGRNHPSQQLEGHSVVLLSMQNNVVPARQHVNPSLNLGLSIVFVPKHDRPSKKRVAFSCSWSDVLVKDWNVLQIKIAGLPTQGIIATTTKCSILMHVAFRSLRVDLRLLSRLRCF